jgi:hypothetical protein
MPEQTVMAWIEDGTGTIVRGQVDSASAQGACVRLAEMPGFGEGDEVAVRVCFAIGAPTVAATARVTGVRASGDVVLCDLQWTAMAESEFDAWPAHAA